MFFFPLSQGTFLFLSDARGVPSLVGLLLQPVQPLLALVVLRTIVRAMVVGSVGLMAQGCAQDGRLCCRGADANAHVHSFCCYDLVYLLDFW